MTNAGKKSLTNGYFLCIVSVDYIQYTIDKNEKTFKLSKLS